MPGLFSQNNFPHKQTRKLWPGLFSPTLFIFVLNCITYYTAEPEPAPEPFSQTSTHVLNFQITDTTRYPLYSKSILRGLQTGGLFSKTLQHYTLKKYVQTDKGSAPYFLEVKVFNLNSENAKIIKTFFSWYFCLGLVPYWYDYTVFIKYTLFKYNSSYEVYQAINRQVYNITRTRFSWLLALPAVWVNLLTAKEEEIVELTARDYITRLALKNIIP